MADLADKVLFITGASRGIGKAIALRAARDGAKLVLAAKTVRPHPKLPGTIHSAAAEVEAAGGEALAVACDVRHEEELQAAVEAAVERFGGIDILVNNAGAIGLTGTLDTKMRSYDRMFAVNARASYLASQFCLPHLLRAANPHILNICPPLDLRSKWFAHHAAYSVSKYGMSLWVVGMAAEFAEQGVAVNGLWPRSTIATAAVRNLLGGEPLVRRSRHASIMGDAAHAILTRNSREHTGRIYLDEEVLREEGVEDFSVYAVQAGAELQLDLFVEGGPEGMMG
jgi:citronellol/citronellal dehydrogenase